MGATKYTEAERVIVLGLYVENVRFGEIVARTGLDRHIVANIMQAMHSRARARYAPRAYYLKQKIGRIHHAAPEPEPTPLQPRARRAL